MNPPRRYESRYLSRRAARGHRFGRSMAVKRLHRFVNGRSAGCRVIIRRSYADVLELPTAVRQRPQHVRAAIGPLV